MSLLDNFTVTETERENLKDGDYIGIIRSISEKMDKYGAYINIEWELIDPLVVAGRLENERFYIGSYDQIKKERAVYQFSKFCKQLHNLKVGEKLSRDILIGKKAQITIKNNLADNGNVYQNTINRMLIEDQDHPLDQKGSSMYGGTSVPLVDYIDPIPTGTYNDEVPFG